MNSWQTISLKEIVISIKGKKPKILLEEQQNGTVPYLDILAFEKGQIRQYADISSSKISEKKDILIVWDGARCGLVGMGYSGAIGSTIAVLRPILLESQYLFYFLQTQYKYINSNPRGSGIPHLDPDILLGIEVPLPPLNEQHRIVAKLEQLLSKVQSCQERLDRIPKILKRFRQSVLAAACSGRLTEDWREQNPDVEWENTILQNVIYEKLRNGYSPKPVKYTTNLKVITLTATTSGKFSDCFFKYINDEIDQNSYLWIKNGDILIQRGNSLEHVGISAIYEGCSDQFIYPDLMIKVVADKMKILNKFLYYILSSFKIRQYFRENATGTAGNMPKINQSVLLNTPIPLPPLAEQQEIVHRVESLFHLADQVEQKYNKAKAYVDQLTQSILAKAFRGELVPQDPNDEPAEVLLERIRKEKASQDKAAGKKRSRKLEG